MDYSPPDSSVCGILQARILDGLPFLSPGDLPDPGTESGSPALFKCLSHQGSLYFNFFFNLNLFILIGG